MEQIILILINVIGMYMIIGAIFSIVFLWRGIAILDKGTKDSGIFFRLLLVPGILVFWPKFLVRWIKQK